MNVEFSRNNGELFPIVIFRRDFNERSYYRFGLSRKTQTGEYENGYMDCQFKKDVDLPNKTKIMVKSAWLTFYLRTRTLADGREIKETVPYIFINEFDYVDSADNSNSVDEYTEEISLGDITPDKQFDIDDLDNFLD